VISSRELGEWIKFYELEEEQGAGARAEGRSGRRNLRGLSSAG